MADANKKIPALILFLFLLIFPFGQIIRLNLNLFGLNLTLQPVDLTAALSLFYLLFRIIRRQSIIWPKYSSDILVFLLFLLFSNLLSIANFATQELIWGSFYLIRLIIYAALFVLTYNFVFQNFKLQKLLFDSLLWVLVFVGLFGWLQYFIYPDIRSFVIWGWDDHLYRLFGTFLDPGFTSILLVLGFNLAFLKFWQNREMKHLPLVVFFFISIGFTYSRAGYLALLSGLTVFLLIHKRIKYLLLIGLGLLILILLLPRPASSGVELERTFSIFSRLDNYRQTLFIWSRSPVFGVGYNNLCLARIKFLGLGNLTSHSCSGSDASLLGLLATGGILGLSLYLRLIIKTIKSVKKNLYGQAYLVSLSALLIHSLFVNSLFYPWVMGLMGLLLALAL